MKSLKESLFDKKGTLDRDVYKYHPRTKKELINYIWIEIDLQGPNANLNIIDTSEITDMVWLFDNSMNIQNIDISQWDVSGVKDMRYMFWGCVNFNSDLSKWDVSKVRNMSNMFSGCTKFNCDLSKWDVGRVEDMNNMFYNCKNFNSDLSRWDVSNVTDMHGMFTGCTSLKKIPSWYK